MSLQLLDSGTSSAQGAILRYPESFDKPVSRPTVMAGSLLLLLAATSPAPTAQAWAQSLCQSPVTTSEPNWQAPLPYSSLALSTDHTQRALFALKSLTGLTWNRIAELFGVSRRSAHFWASGKPLSQEHERHLYGVLSTVNEVDIGDSRIMCAAILDDSGGRSALSALLEREYEEGRLALAKSIGRQVTLREQGRRSMSSYYTPPPDELLEALQDRVHREVGSGRPARTARTWRRDAG